MQNGRVLSIAGLGLVLAALIANHAFGRLTPAPPHLLPVETLPRMIGAWKGGRDMPVDPELHKVLPTARIVERDYTDGSGHVVDLVLISAADYKDIHDPGICFPSQGYTLDNQTVVTTDGQVIQGMTATRGANQFDVRYWLVGDDRGLISRIPLTKALALQSLLQHTSVQSLFVRLVTPHSASSDQVLKDFTRQLAAPIRALVESKHA